MKSDEILVKQKGYRFTGAIQQGNGQPSCFIKDFTTIYGTFYT